MDRESALRLLTGGEDGVKLWNKARESRTKPPDLSSANLEGANLKGADLIRTVLPGANLSGAKLSHAQMSAADLTNADLSRATLYRAKLDGAQLINVNLSGANLWYADLRDATLTGAKLDGANLSNAAVDSDADLVADAVWSAVNIDDRTYRRDRLHIDPLPFGMGPSLALAIRFGGLTEANWKLLCGMADSMMAGGTYSMVVHQGGEDRFEVRTFGVEREPRLLDALAQQTAKLGAIAESIERIAWLGLSDAERPALKARLLSTLATVVDEQDARALVAMHDGPARRALALARETAFAVLRRKLLAGLGG